MDSLWSLLKEQPDIKPVKHDACLYCKSSYKLSEDGFLICSNKSCSIIIEHTIDNTPEWSFYDGDAFTSNPIRCGPPINKLLEESSIGCKVLCSGKTSPEMRKIARFADWSMPYKEKTRYDDFMYIERMAVNAYIPMMIVRKAFDFYTRISEKQSFRGLNRDGIIAASIYIACRIEKFPRTPKEIAKIFQLDTTSSTKGCKNAMTILNEIEKDLPVECRTTYSNTNPLSFIDRYCSHLLMNEQFTKLAKFMAIQIEKNNLIPENTPQSIAAGIVYVISQEFHLDISQKSIQAISDTSAVTITKCYRKIDAIKTTLIPQSLYEKYKNV